MKNKISELESRGIQPDRSNVQPHLNNIKMFTKSGQDQNITNCDLSSIFLIQVNNKVRDR